MEASRAQQILKGNDTVDVKLNGVSVWIDQVDLANRSVKIHAQHNPADVRTVSCEQLEEA
ncbi:H-type small acid-soluble spore protein [Paenibacillus cymbidii]|uniref:H-type small acid-soluble spore protein n=1 Tax=Paenibacillus cymbidii TaxID=1639034 RepID=UPI0010800B6F|nr:H-type small acid-soluble spore protein [Paenibacillus cymbidii]